MLNINRPKPYNVSLWESVRIQREHKAYKWSTILNQERVYMAVWYCIIEADEAEIIRLKALNLSLRQTNLQSSL